MSYYDSISFQWVIYSLLFIVPYFTLILIIISTFNFWLDLILILYVYKSKFNIMYAVSCIYLNLSLHCFPFSSFQGKFFLSKEKGLFHPYHRQRFFFCQTFLFTCRPKVWQLNQITVTIGNSIPRLSILPFGG